VILESPTLPHNLWSRDVRRGEEA